MTCTTKTYFDLVEYNDQDSGDGMLLGRKVQTHEAATKLLTRLRSRGRNVHINLVALPGEGSDQHVAPLPRWMRALYAKAAFITMRFGMTGLSIKCASNAGFLDH